MIHGDFVIDWNEMILGLIVWKVMVGSVTLGVVKECVKASSRVFVFHSFVLLLVSLSGGNGRSLLSRNDYDTIKIVGEILWENPVVVRDSTLYPMKEPC